MPHIALKMLKGRTPAQKQVAVEKLTAALQEAIGCSDCHISMSIEEYAPEAWQDVFREQVTENPALVKKPDYDPKDLL